LIHQSINQSIIQSINQINHTGVVYLAEHTSATWCAGWFVWRAVHAHGFPVTRELEGEFFLPHLLDDMVTGHTLFTFVETSFVSIEVVDFLYKDGEGSLGGFTDLLIYSLSLQIHIEHGIILWFKKITRLFQKFLF
jgi:hypothetical protein